jgi:hypothetical protein
MNKRIYDCFIYDGRENLLEIRFNELSDVIDYFVIVECTRTPQGKPKELYFRKQFPRFRKFAPKIRYIVVPDMPAPAKAREGEGRWRDSIVRGLADAESHDLILLSAVDQIPRAAVISEISDDLSQDVVSLRMSLVSFAPDEGKLRCAEPSDDGLLAIRRHVLDDVTPGELPAQLDDKAIQPGLREDAGWHFADVARRGESGTWEIADLADLPIGLAKNPESLAKLQESQAPGLARSRWPLTKRLNLRQSRDREPVIVCPYLYDSEEAEIRNNFRLDGDAGRGLEFFLWQDTEGVGPELAFEHCWDQFPGRDIIIVHSDMTPLPEDQTNRWYRDILDHRDRLPDAGMIACDLLYPLKDKAGNWYIQCAGGYFQQGELGFLGGHVDITQGSAGAEALSYEKDFRRVREVEWVTFGGIYIRREVIETCGPFDRAYEWAYVRDVDYSLEARLRGFRLYQVPVNLLHHESRTTRPILSESPDLSEKVERNFTVFRDKWRWYTHDERGFPWAGARFRPWDGTRVEIGGVLSERFLDFERGWQTREPWGRWSDGRESVLKFKWPAGHSRSADLRLWAHYFDGSEDTDVLVNDRPVGSIRFGSKAPTTIPIDLGESSRRDGVVTLRFHHHNPVSPRQLGQSEDPRMIKFGLRAVELA